MDKKNNKEAIARANNASISTKQSIAICKFLKGKSIDQAVKELTEVIKMKRAIPMHGEIPHRKGGFPGRYPVKAADLFIKLLKNLEANANIKGLDITKTKISAKADKASRPRKPGRLSGRRFKRTHITLILKKP